MAQESAQFEKGPNNPGHKTYTKGIPAIRDRVREGNFTYQVRRKSRRKPRERPTEVFSKSMEKQTALTHCAQGHTHKDTRDQRSGSYDSKFKGKGGKGVKETKAKAKVKVGKEATEKDMHARLKDAN
jgi:pyocin large subunit-like protein